MINFRRQGNVINIGTNLYAVQASIISNLIIPNRTYYLSFDLSIRGSDNVTGFQYLLSEKTTIRFNGEPNIGNNVFGFPISGNKLIRTNIIKYNSISAKTILYNINVYIDTVNPLTITYFLFGTLFEYKELEKWQDETYLIQRY